MRRLMASFFVFLSLVSPALAQLSQPTVPIIGLPVIGATSNQALYVTSGAVLGQLPVALDAANIVAFRNGTTAQTTRFYRTFTDASNGKWLDIDTNWASVNIFAVIASGNGTGAAGQPLLLGSNSTLFFFTNSATRWVLDSSGHLYPNSDNAYDIGLTTTNRVRDVYVARDLFRPGGTQAMFRTTAAITTGAGANVGTLTNSPVTGNPTKWYPINDNGTTLYVPAW